MELAKTLRHYGRIPAGEAVTESVNVGGTGAGPDATCRVRVSLASKELTLLSLTQPAREQRYKVTRMRCWRIITLHSVSLILFFNIYLYLLQMKICKKSDLMPKCSLKLRKEDAVQWCTVLSPLHEDNLTLRCNR